MIGVSISILQPNGVTTTWATIVDISWQPGKSANVRIGYFIDEPTYNSGAAPVCTQYFQIDITQINPAAAIPGQLISQLMAVGAPLNGGTLTLV